MSKLFYKVVIEEVCDDSDSCSRKEVYLLVDGFVRLVKKMATTLAREAYYKLVDFRVENQIKDFSLNIEKRYSFSDRYIGIFRCEGKELIVYADLKKE